ncbi:unnamed protein product, partial [Staurois parvus]
RTLHSLYLVSHRPCIHYIWSPTDPEFTISGLPRPCIHYIWSPQTLHSLYLVSPDPAFTISGLPRPCIHISGLPTLHSLYLVSHRPCIHYIWSPTVHITLKCNYFSKYKLL